MSTKFESARSVINPGITLEIILRYSINKQYLLIYIYGTDANNTQLLLLLYNIASYDNIYKSFIIKFVNKSYHLQN